MAQMRLAAARVVDPVLSRIAQGYRNNEMIARMLFPRVDVDTRAGNIITFGKDEFFLYTNLQRSPGENTKRIQIGYAGSPFALIDYSLEGKLPVEVKQEAAAVTIDMQAATIYKVEGAMDLRLEYQSAQLARTAGNYPAGNKVTLSGTSQWSDFSGTSDPVANIETAKEAIRAATGRRPNVMIMGAAVMSKLKQHPKIIDRVKYTGRDIATPALLEDLFGLKVFVGDSVYATDAGVFGDVWGKDVVIAYTELASIRDMGTPSFGYTYNLNPYTYVDDPYYEHNSKSWIFPVTRTEAPVIAGSSAGYLITNAVA